MMWHYHLLLFLLPSLLYKQLNFINETTNPGTLHRVTGHVPVHISLLADDVSYHRHVHTHWTIQECVKTGKQVFPPGSVFAIECKPKSCSKNEYVWDASHRSSKLEVDTIEWVLFVILSKFNDVWLQNGAVLSHWIRGGFRFPSFDLILCLVIFILFLIASVFVRVGLRIFKLWTLVFPRSFHN